MKGHIVALNVVQSSLCHNLKVLFDVSKEVDTVNERLLQSLMDVFQDLIYFCIVFNIELFILKWLEFFLLRLMIDPIDLRNWCSLERSFELFGFLSLLFLVSRLMKII